MEIQTLQWKHLCSGLQRPLSAHGGTFIHCEQAHELVAMYTVLCCICTADACCDVRSGC